VKPSVQVRRRKLWLTFGLWLPIVCFTLDHGGVFGAWTSCIRWFVGVELALFVWQAWWPPRSEFARGAMLAAFLLGVLFALVSGVCLLRSALIGAIALIGLLGLVPWGTAVAYAVACGSLLDTAQARNGLSRSVGALVAVLVLFGPPTLLRQHELAVARAARAALHDENSIERALELLEALPSADVACLPLEPKFANLLRSDLDLWIEWNWTTFAARFPLGFP
jgi:hypothetical protein